MKWWLALAVGLGSVWWLLRILRKPNPPDTVSAAWMREQLDRRILDTLVHRLTTDGAIEMEIRMTPKLLVQVTHEGYTMYFNVEDARELRDWLLSEPSITVPTAPVACDSASAKKR